MLLEEGGLGRSRVVGEHASLGNSVIGTSMCECSGGSLVTLHVCSTCPAVGNPRVPPLVGINPCIATKVFIDKLPATRGVCVIIG